jgi:hypothetical protein
MKEVMDPSMKKINEAKRKHPKWDEEDPIRDSITSLFEDRVGKPFSESELGEIYKEGQTRFSKKIPPGFLDQTKDAEAKYGDLIGWKQILNYAKEVSKPIIFITDEKYEDWWWKINDEIVGPRYELVKEMSVFCGMFFTMYNSRLFHKQAAKFLKRKINQNVNKEITEITESHLPKEEVNVTPNQVKHNLNEELGTGEKTDCLDAGEPII